MPFDNSQYPDRRFKRSRTESEVSEKNPDEAVGDAQPMNGAESNEFSVEGEDNSRNQEWNCHDLGWLISSRISMYVKHWIRNAKHVYCKTKLPDKTVGQYETHFQPTLSK